MLRMQKSAILIPAFLRSSWLGKKSLFPVTTRRFFQPVSPPPVTTLSLRPRPEGLLLRETLGYGDADWAPVSDAPKSD